MNSLIDDCNVVDIFKVEFCSAAPTVWNSLPANLLDINISRGQFARLRLRCRAHGEYLILQLLSGPGVRDPRAPKLESAHVTSVRDSRSNVGNDGKFLGTTREAYPGVRDRPT